MAEKIGRRRRKRRRKIKKIGRIAMERMTEWAKFLVRAAPMEAWTTGVAEAGDRLVIGW
jgi:hypothetical protein